MTTHIKPAMFLFTLLSILTGLLYPAIVTALAQILLPHQANGSLITDAQGKAVGSELIGQTFSDPKYFWGRPSATSPYAGNAGASSGSNLGPANPALVEAVKARTLAIKEADPGNDAPIPVDLVTASGSGLDPHISPAAADYQISRVAKARHMEQKTLRDLIEAHTESRQWLVFGEPRVDVLRLNLALDRWSR